MDSGEEKIQDSQDENKKIISKIIRLAHPTMLEQLMHTDVLFLYDYRREKWNPLVTDN